jgi:hypothetical protein
MKDTMFINTHDQWLQEYRKDKYKVWIRVTLSNGIDYYLPDHESWLKLKPLCEKQKLKVIKVGLQYRSNYVEVDTADTDGVYLIRSIIGMMGETSRQSITIGKLYGTTLKKELWVTPELISEIKDETNVEDCFKEALILNYETQETKTRTI